MLNLAELNHLSELELVQWYFLRGFYYKEITMLLSNQHVIDISLRLIDFSASKLCTGDTIKTQ